MHLSGFDRFVWAATFFGQVLLLAVLFSRRRARSFPAFTIYIAQSACTTAVLYFVFNHFSFEVYRSNTSTLTIVDVVFQLFVVYELALNVFRPTGTWARDALKTFVATVCASILVAGLLTWLANPTVRLSIQAFMLRSDFFCSMLMSELFVGMIVLSSTYGLPWKTHAARIAQGLGTFSIICVGKDIVLNSVVLRQHMRLYYGLDHLRVLTYLGCEAFWIIMLWQEAPVPRELPEKMRMQIYTLQRRVEYDLMRIRNWGKS